VVSLIGVVTAGDPLLVVIEYCEHGALNSFLEKNEIGDACRLGIAGDCAEGMAYLAGRRFIHRDLAARNVLLSSDFHAKISDFGLSRETIDSNYYHSQGGQLPVRWTAPEALEEQRFSQASDVWSFGVLMYEIWTRGELPYKEMNNQKVWVSVTTGHRLEQPDECPKEIYAIMKQCWHIDPQQRPEFRDLQSKLRWLHTKVDLIVVAKEPRPSLVAQADYVDFVNPTLLRDKSFVPAQSIKKPTSNEAQPETSTSSNDIDLPPPSLSSENRYSSVVLYSSDDSPLLERKFVGTRRLQVQQDDDSVV
jgi:serine/threonine protein kinase